MPRELVIADQVALDVHDPHVYPPHARIAAARPGSWTGLARGQAGARGRARRRERRKERLDKIKELFRKAVAYDAVVTKARERGEAPPAPIPGSRPWSPTPAARSR